MERCRDKKDFDQLAKLAHWLKGTGGTVGFHDFTEPARALQESAERADESAIDRALAELNELAQRITLTDEQVACVS